MSWATKEPGGRTIYTGTTTTTTTTATNASPTRTGGGWSGSVSPQYGSVTKSNGGGGGTQQEQLRDDRDMNDVTKRMVKLAVEANDMADESLRGLESQNEEIKKQQDEVASMADQINIADRKMKGIRSFFSHLGNQFKKDNSNEHQKARQKYEKDYAKQNFKIEAEKQKIQELEHNSKIEINNCQLKLAAEKDEELMRQAKVQSHQDYKAIKRGGGPNNTESDGGPVIFGKNIVFQQNQVPGEQCEAENNLDEVALHVKQLKIKAENMNDLVVESHKRIADVHTDLNDVQARTVAATKKGEKIIKNDSFF